jgi:TonB-linked SusC/RagA family outer membrane protein
MHFKALCASTTRACGITKQTLLIMKLTIIFLFIACLQVQANGYAQTVTLSEKKAPLFKIFREIHKQTGFKFFYEEEVLNRAGKIDIQVSNAPIDQVLKICLSNLPVTFSIVDGTIVLKEKPVPSVVQVINYLITVTGKVVNDKGEPMESVTVSVKNSSKATSTNVNGQFTLADVDENATLVFTGVGIEKQEIKIGGRKELVVVTKTKVSQSEEVIVSTGYQRIPKERVTGSFTNISAEDLERSNSFNLKDRIEGLVPGMYFEPQFDEDQSPTGERSRSIVIRGVGTFGNNNPLIVVDGAPFYTDVIDPWTLINPSDVENITVLKDAAAASIWGSQAANGVIVITTKKGSIMKGQPMLQVSMDYLVQPVPNLSKIPWASSKEAVDIYRWMITNKTWFDQHLVPTFKDRYELPEVMDVLLKMKMGTMSQADGNKRLEELSNIDVRDEFRDLFFRKVESNKKINLSFQTGSEFHRVRTSITGLFNNQYSKGNSDFQVTTNFVDEYTPKKWLKVSIGANYFLSDMKRNGVVVNELVNIPQMSRILDDQGNYLPMIMNNAEDSYFDVPTWRRRDTAAKYKLPYNWDWNLKQDVDNYDKSTKTSNLRLYTNITVTPFRGLDVDFYYQYQKDHILLSEYYNEKTWYVRNMVNNNARPNGTYPIPPGGMLYQSQTDGYSHNGRGQLSYTRVFGDHSIRALAGMEVRQNVYDRVPYGYYGYDPQSLTNITNLDFLNTITPKMNGDPAGFGTSTIPFSPTQRFGTFLAGNDDRFVSKYANAGYTFKNRYDLTGSIRQDITNLFGQSSTYTNLPQWSVGAGWKISGEKFFTYDFINNLKLRVSYGFNGNIDKTASPYITGTPWIDPLLGIPYAAVQQAPNPGLTWEKTRVYNIGLDYAFLDNRINGSFEYYKKRATDVLAQIAVNGTYGYQNNRATLNTGTITNKGFEFNVTGRIIEQRNFRWETRFNYGTNRNRATDITQVNKSTIAYTTLAFYYHLPNQPVDFVAAAKWMGYDSLGYDKFEYQKNVYSIRDIANFNTLNQGDIFQVVGQRSPKHYGQWANTVSFKGFDLNVSLLYKFGHVFVKDYPATGMSNTYFTATRYFTFFPELMVNRWQSLADGNNASMYSLENKLTNTNQVTLLDYVSRYNTRNVLNAGSIRMQSISLTYSIPAKISGPIKNARLQLEARNLGPVYLVNDEGIDPDFPPYSSSVYGALQYVIRNRPQYSASLRFGL